MLIPLGTDRPRRRPTLVTYWLIGLCVVMFVVQLVLERAGDAGFAGFLGGLVLEEGSAGSRWWSVVTYQFLHGDVLHLLGNMLFLFVFGPAVEDRFGRAGFAGFYLAGGVVAGLAQVALEGGAVIGASGSISAVTGAFLVLFPLTRVRVLLFFFLIGVFEIPAWWIIAIAIARDLVFVGADDSVARLAHLAGYAFGASVPLVLLWRGVLKRETYDLFSIGRQAQRRRRFKAMASGSGPTGWERDAGRAVGKGLVNAKERQREEAIASIRREVQRALGEGDRDGAADRYLRGLDEHPGLVMSRDAQHALGAHLMERGRHQPAAAVFERFLDRYPKDRERAHVMLLLALINARYLNDPVEAKRLLGALEGEAVEASSAELMRTLREELG